ncbi:ribulose-phosphate 3-epimerase [Candidatus Gottesmanbacteria bacterium]|nr:ribulose-phosphate 3-epimerase [Candidatus Gottesmanbacteria bacterium]
MGYQGVLLSASIMCMEWLNLKSGLDALENSIIDYLHYDIMDGYFVSNFGIPNFIIEQIKGYTKTPSDYHLMVEEPRRIFDQIIPEEDAFVSIHYEACRNLHRDLVTLRKMKFRPGIVINPATSPHNIEYIIEEVDIVVIMTVNPGLAGQNIVQQTLKKVSQLKEWRKSLGLDFKIGVDGNVSFDNIPNMVRAGADLLILGTSGLFVKEMMLRESFKRLHLVIEEGIKLRNCDGD